jgi:WD40 repeat protein
MWHTSRLEDLYVRESPPSTVDLSFSPNNEFLATCTAPLENIIRVSLISHFVLQFPYFLIVQIWEVAKKHVRNAFKGHLDSIYTLDFSPDGRLLISGSSDRTIRLWNMRGGSSRIFHCSRSYISPIRFSPDGRYLAAGKFNGDVLLWDMRSGHLVAALEGHTNSVSSIIFMPNGEGLISAGGMILKSWDFSGSTMGRILGQSDGGLKKRFTFVGHMVRSFLSWSRLLF